MHVQSVQKYCFSLSNMQISDVLVFLLRRRRCCLSSLLCPQVLTPTEPKKLARLKSEANENRKCHGCFDLLLTENFVISVAEFYYIEYHSNVQVKTITGSIAGISLDKFLLYILCSSTCKQ